MGWSTALDYLKRQAGKSGVDSAQPEARADDALPLHARIGSLVTIQQTPFIRAGVNGSLIVAPAPGQTLIRAIGHLRLGFPGKIFRYYLETGDDGNEREKFLQLVVDPAGEVLEMLYCSRFTRFIPQTKEDQDAFMGVDGQGLGQRVYSLFAQQLAENGYTDEQIAAALQGAEQLDFIREAGNPADDWVEPFTGTEVRIDDAIGQKGLEQNVWFMPYVRQLGEGREYLLITTEVVNSQDGDTSRRAIHVDLVVGIPLEPERVTIQ